MPPVAASACEYAVPTVPFGSVVVVMASAASTVIDSACVAVRPSESLTWTVNACVSAVVGVPLIVPVTLLNHYVRKYDQPYLKQQVYLNPHPIALKLRNHA